MLHWPYPMQTGEAINFLRSAEIRTGKSCFVRHAVLGTFDKWKIFTSEDDCESYLRTRTHRR